MVDQANKLRNMVKGQVESVRSVKNEHPIKIYSVVSGKGGVGKTNFSVNLAIKMQQKGKRVLILDADIGMSNANIMIGIETPLNLFALLKGNASLKDIIVRGPEGIDLLSGGADLFYMEGLDYTRQQAIIEKLRDLDCYDILIIDNGAGISKHSLTFSIFAHEVILVTTPEPTALTDAYRVLKAISYYKLKDKVKIIVNQVIDKQCGEEAFYKLSKTVEQFLSIQLDNIGFIYADQRVNKAIMSQSPIVLKYPYSIASKNIADICTNILEDKDYSSRVSNIKQIGKRLINIFR